MIEVKYREDAGIADHYAIVEHSDQAASAIITKRLDDFGEHTSETGNKLLRIQPSHSFVYWDMQREAGIKESSKVFLYMVKAAKMCFYELV